MGFLCVYARFGLIVVDVPNGRCLSVLYTITGSSTAVTVVSRHVVYCASGPLSRCPSPSITSDEVLLFCKGLYTKTSKMCSIEEMLPTIDLSNQQVLITGGTQGIGWGIARHFAHAKAQLYLTYKWGSANNEELIQECCRYGAPPPHLLEADVAEAEDTERLMQAIAAHTDGIDIFISNVAFAPRIEQLADYKKKSFFRAVEYSSWPIISYLQAIECQFGRYPRYVIAISSDGPSHYYRGYDFVAATKALLEHFTRYLSIHLLPFGTCTNVVRFGTVQTDSFNAIFGKEFFEFAKKEGLTEAQVLTTDDCGRAVLALCSGLLDSLNGQTITLDYGVTFKDNLMMKYIDSRKEESND